MVLSKRVLEFIEHEKVTVSKRSDLIIHVEFKPNIEITVEFQDELVAMYNQLTGGKKSLFIFEGGEFVSITKEARENAITIEDNTPTRASAIVVRNLAQKIVADFYYKINKPKQPFKVFWSFEKGIIWLQSLKIQDN
jgi:UPF0288 family protein (methanogenesis marker protein 3)